MEEGTHKRRLQMRRSDTLAGLNQLGFHGRERPGRLTQKIHSRLGSDGPQAQLMYDRSGMEICIVAVDKS